MEESHSTLRFACRTKRVVNNATVNEVVTDAAVLKRQAKEIEELKSRLSGWVPKRAQVAYCKAMYFQCQWPARKSTGRSLQHICLHNLASKFYRSTVTK